jgi:general secretion pathway protein K
MKNRCGFALIAALWLVVALAAAGLDIGLRGRAHRLIAANTLEAAQGRAAAEAGVEHVRARLAFALRSGDDAASILGALDPWRVLHDLLEDTIALGNARYHVNIQDPAAHVHLDRADEEQLRSLLRALRVDYGEADRIAQAAADWRDADDFRRPRGAEREDYLREGLPLLARDAPFRNVEEFAFVRGMTPSVFARVRPFLTLHGNGQINLNTAPEPVLLSIPGITPEAAAVVLRFRRSGQPIRRIQELTDALPPVARQAMQERLAAITRAAIFETRQVLVESEGWVDGSPVHARATALVSWGGTSVAVGWRRIEP